MATPAHRRPRPRAIVITFDDCQSLDVTGPAEVFAAALDHGGGRGYQVILASVAGGVVRGGAGFGLDTVKLSTLRPRPTDVVVVAGGGREGVVAAMADRALLAWLGRARGVVARLASVCSGAFVLAATGALDGRRVATHWSACDRLAAFRPAVTVDRDAIFIADGAIWTSAGVTTGIDMALAMVELDHGRAVADRIAAQLVLYTRRPGFQSQWSAALVAQVRDHDGLAGAITWARGHLAALDVPTLARRAGLSVRSLHRRCGERLRLTPAKLIEQLRIEQARALLAAGKLPAKAVARQCGFGEPARMTRAFRRALGVRPRDYRLLFAPAADLA
jgi:transcriptional regulator GlxA family with amidase domain